MSHNMARRSQEELPEEVQENPPPIGNPEENDDADQDYDPNEDPTIEEEDLFFDSAVGDDDGTTTVKFAAVPAQSNTSILDYSTRAGMTLYEGAVKPLEHKFKLTSQRLLQFLVEVERQANDYFWTPNFMVP